MIEIELMPISRGLKVPALTLVLFFPGVKVALCALNVLVDEQGISSLLN